MPAFPQLSDRELRELVKYLRSPVGEVSYTVKDIKESRKELATKNKNLGIKNVKNLVVVVEKGKGRVWLMEGEEVLDRFPFKNVHGGVKFSPDGRDFYVPARDGRVLRYSLEEGRPKEEVRACVYLRNIAVSRDGNFVVAGCILPSALVVMDRGLNPTKLIPFKGRLSAVYQLNERGGFIFTFRNKPYVGFLGEEFKLSLKRIDSPLEDFFIDPLEMYLIGSSREGKEIAVYEINGLKKVYGRRIDSLPHLFSSFFWYKDGKFFFATRHAKAKRISVWRMYDWKLEREIETEGSGFFVRTHPLTPYLWIDNSSDTLLLVDKRDFSVKKLKVVPGKRATHVEFSADGRIAYISVYDRDGNLVLMDAQTLETITRLPADRPAGKYNFVMKGRRFYPALLGYEVFMAKCWGCHHQEEKAFAPSFRWIANHREPAQILSHIANPEKSAPLLGYKRSAMPRIELSKEEVYSLLSFIESFKHNEEGSHGRH